MLTMMGLPVDLRFKLSEEECVRALRRHAMRHPFIWVAGGFLVLSIGFALLCSSDNKPGPGAATWSIVAVGLGIYLFYTLLVAPGRAYRVLSLAIRESELNYRFTATGVELKSESFQARWDWKLFGHFTEEKDAFLIFPKAPGNYILLPKRALSSAESMNALRELLRSSLKVW